MVTQLLVVIDIGTTNLKSVVFDLHGEIISESSEEINNIYSRLGPGWVELDAEDIWRTLCSTLKKAISGINLQYEIIGVGITTLRQTIVPVNKDGDPLRYAIPWHIKATYPQSDWIKENIGIQKIYNITGLIVDPLWTLPSIVYLKEKEKNVLDNAYKLLEIQDFIVKRLGSDDFVTDHTQASCLSLLDINTLEWSSELLEKIGLSKTLLPKLVPPGQVVGEVTKKVSELTSLPYKCPIVLAGGDSQCSALGCGLIRKNDTNVVIGTSAVAMSSTEEPIFDPEMRLVVHPHSAPGTYVLDHNTLTGGIAYRWFRDQFCFYEYNCAKNLEISPYEIINIEIAKVPIGSNGTLFIPHFVGAASPYWNDLASGVFLGLNANTTKADIGRSIIEGVALEVKKGLNIMETLGVKISEVRLSGGGCLINSPWTRIQADVYGKPVLLFKTNETTALGAAVLCAYGVSCYGNVDDAINEMVHITHTVEPNLNATPQYQEILSLQDKAYNVLAESDIYDELKQITLKLHQTNSQ